MTLAACGIGIQGSGVRLTETRDLPPFTRIDASGTGQLAVTVDGVTRDTVALEVEGDDNIVALVSTEVVDGELIVRLETSSPLYDTIPLRLRVAIPELTHLQSSDSIDVRVDGVSGDALVLTSTGSSDVTISGDVDWLELHGADSADIYARGLHAANSVVTASGTSDIEVCTSGALAIEASGSADVTYYCSPSSLESQVSGSADVTAGR